eukprot:CAMPEP_0198126172 /NCGR_PEP_ID=MMETSP1442-20131203/44224_1 /TAXON_ID= /ORGANISM="Craspedostauros australis, Strain CCMP3328" /LENGTH=235 /DNA_ID=CAMNT_0043785917 /DNA_START=667 /DNA_END=1374 /DNA_ORIENTATION=-
MASLMDVGFGMIGSMPVTNNNNFEAACKVGFPMGTTRRPCNSNTNDGNDDERDEDSEDNELNMFTNLIQSIRSHHEQQWQDNGRPFRPLDLSALQPASQQLQQQQQQPMPNTNSSQISAASASKQQFLLRRNRRIRKREMELIMSSPNRLTQGNDNDDATNAAVTTVMPLRLPELHHDDRTRSRSDSLIRRIRLHRRRAPSSTPTTDDCCFAATMLATSQGQQKRRSADSDSEER